MLTGMCDLDEPVLGYGELLRGGLTRRQVNEALASGQLRRVRRGVYASSGACDAVVAAASHGGTMACVTAARHLGLWVLEDGRLHVWNGNAGHRYCPDDCSCVVHWSTGEYGRRFRPPDLRVVLAQISACCGAEAFFVALESALRQGLLDRYDRRWLHARLDAVGRDLLRYARSDADSGLESLFRLRLRDLADRIRSQVRVFGVGRVDFLIDGRVIIEIDGRAGHAEGTDRDKDLGRDAAAASWGYVTLRFTYAMIVHDWDLVERSVRTALSA